jgi:protein-tyrosine kinase
MNQADTPTPAIGDIIARLNSLDAGQINAIIEYQKENNLKFGEAAMALGFAKREDIVWALSLQFKYPYQGQEPHTISSDLVVATDPFDAPAEFFRDIRSHLLSNVFAPSVGQRQALAVCSVDIGDGKSFFASNLAVAFSQLSGRTLLIDADMRSPSLQEIFGLKDVGAGLSTMLSGRAEVNVVRPNESLPNLYVLPVGVVPPNPLELIQGQAFDDLIRGVLSKFDYVIVDTPAATHGADSRVIAAKCGASVLLARRGVTAIKPMKALVTNLKKSCSVFGGVLFNDHLHR